MNRRLSPLVPAAWLCLSWAAAFGGATTATAPAGRTVALTILHVNDIHGQTRGSDKGGGYARLATAVERARGKEGPPMLLVHAGDEFSRGDELTRRTLGEANVEIMNRLAFDAWTPGNGEFYDGPANLRRRVAQAKFSVLAANVRFASDGKPVGRPYVICRAGPARVALLGLCLVKADHPSASAFRQADPIATAKELVPLLRRQADVVVALTHLGFAADCRLAAQVAGIDLIVGGHSHTVLQSGYRAKGPDGGNVLIVQAGEQLRFLGRADLTLREETGGWRVESAQAGLVPLDKQVGPDPQMDAFVGRLWAAASRPAVTQPAR